MIYHVTKPEWRQESEEIIYVNPNKIARIITFLHKEKQLCFDTETTGLDAHECELFCYQIGTREHQFVIDHRVVPISMFKELLEEKVLIGVNLKFDLNFLYKYGIYPRQVIDVMNQEVLLTAGLYTPGEIKKTRPYSFKTLSEKYLQDEEVDKSVGASFALKPYDEPLWIKEIVYAAKDVVNPFGILDAQQEIITERKLQTVVNLENSFTLALASMEFNGIYLDLHEWVKIQSEVDIRLDKMLKQLSNELLNSPIKNKTIRFSGKTLPLFYEYETQGGELKQTCTVNWSSPDQVKQVFSLLDIDVDSINQQKILKLKKVYPFIETYLEYKEYASLKSKFTDKIPEYIQPSTSRIHTDFWQIVSTGRMSASRPALQQIPSKGQFGKSIRHSFRASEGNVLVTSDFSGCELRIIAEGSQDPLWVNTFNEGKDLHGIIASELFGITPEESRTLDFPLKPGTKYRDVVKIVNFGLAYGLTEYKLSDTIGSTVEEAKDLIDNYFAKVPRVKLFLDSLAKEVRTTGVAKTFKPVSRPRYFDIDSLSRLSKKEAQYKLASYERAGMNAPIQGCNADIIKVAICKVYDYCKVNKYPAKLTMVLHDELVCEVPEHLGQEWKQIQERLMIEAGSLFIKSIPIVVETNVGTFWSH